MSSNYHTSLARNLMLIAILFVVIAFLWLFYAAISHQINKSKKKRDPNHTRCSNFAIRFLYEVFFELCLCIMISLSVSGVTKWELILSCLLVALAVISLCTLTLLCYKGGPYISNTYEKRSLKGSFWHIRAIREDIIAKVLD